MMSMRYMITAANGDLGEAVAGVIKDIDRNSIIIGTELKRQKPASHYCDYVKMVPKGSDEQYISAIEALVEADEIDFIIPCSEPEVLRFSELNEDSVLASKVVQPNQMFVPIFSDKYETFKWLSGNGFRTPRTWLPNGNVEREKLAFPLLAKPRSGSGSSGIFKIECIEMYDAIAKQYGDGYVIQELIAVQDSEYTCALYAGKQELRSLILHRRLDAGRTVEATVASNIEIETTLRRLATSIQLNGLINVQLMLTNNGPVIFEINPRVSSTVLMRHRLGFQDLKWELQKRSSIAIDNYHGASRSSIFRLSRELVL